MDNKIENAMLILFAILLCFISIALFQKEDKVDDNDNVTAAPTEVNNYKIIETEEVLYTRGSIPYETSNFIEETTQKETSTHKQTEMTINEVEDEYFYAREIWEYLRYEMGLNKYCAAGIMGNIMTECGGQTLNIQPYITNSSGHYGICQWNLRYFPEVRGKSLHGQLEFLNSTIRWIMNDFGDRYYDGFNYNKFIEITDERVAAEAFAYAYEGSPKPCSQRRLNHATTALNYFEGE